MYCTAACTDDQFACEDSGRCIPRFNRCSWEAECEDGSDQKDCSKIGYIVLLTFIFTRHRVSENVLWIFIINFVCEIDFLRTGLWFRGRNDVWPSGGRSSVARDDLWRYVWVPACVGVFVCSVVDLDVYIYSVCGGESCVWSGCNVGVSVLYMYGCVCMFPTFHRYRYFRGRLSGHLVKPPPPTFAADNHYLAMTLSRGGASIPAYTPVFEAMTAVEFDYKVNPDITASGAHIKVYVILHRSSGKPSWGDCLGGSPHSGA